MTQQFISPADPAEPSIQHLRFSPSQLDVWDRCLKKGYYVYRKGYRGAVNTPATRKGTIIHKALELYHGSSWSMMEVMDNAEDIFPVYEDQRYLMELVALLLRYEAYYSSRDTKMQVLAVEANLCVPFDTPAGNRVYINGIIDMIGETENGELFVMDHKSTGRAFWTSDSVYFDRQLHLYMAMMYLMGYDPRIGVINNINTATNVKNAPAEKLFTRVAVRIDEGKLTRYLSDVGHRIDQILSYQDFPRNLNKSCGECQFKDACSLALQGIDETDLLESNFRNTSSGGFELVLKKE